MQIIYYGYSISTVSPSLIIVKPPRGEKFLFKRHKYPDDVLMNSSWF